MFDISTQLIENDYENQIITKNISLDDGLDVFILINSKDNVFNDNLLNNTIGYFIDKISKQETYKDFSIALENINSFVSTWKNELQGGILDFDMVVTVLNEDKLMFSNIGDASVIIVNKDSQIIELTEKNDSKKEFSFISEGKLFPNEIIIISNINVLKYLSKSDILESMVLIDDLNMLSKNIKNIFLSEILDKNIALTFIKTKAKQNSKKIDKIFLKKMLINLSNTKIGKHFIFFYIKVLTKIKNQKELVKNCILGIGIIFCVMFLYTSLSKIISISTKSELKQEAKLQIQEAKSYLAKASENLANKAIFEKNIDKTNSLIKSLQSKDLFLSDIEKINKEINTLKKHFNKIEFLSIDKENTILNYDFKNSIGIISSNVFDYVITKKGVIGPISSKSKLENYIFDKLDRDEYFIDFVSIDSDLFLLTNNSNIVSFSKNGHFSFANVFDQKKWEEMKMISSYSSSIYSLGKDNQIYKHKKTSKGFKQGIEYLKQNDIKQIGDILDIAIDGGIFILKKDLSIVKFFRSPYRLESIFLNKLPDNYYLEEDKKIDLKAGNNLKYIYMLLNNKIWLFKPNNNDFRNTQSLEYIGQIEIVDNNIIDFYVKYDGEIIVLTKNSINKINFEISDNSLFLK